MYYIMYLKMFCSSSRSASAFGNLFIMLNTHFQGSFTDVHYWQEPEIKWWLSVVLKRGSTFMILYGLPHQLITWCWTLADSMSITGTYHNCGVLWGLWSIKLCMQAYHNVTWSHSIFGNLKNSYISSELTKKPSWGRCEGTSQLPQTLQ